MSSRKSTEEEEELSALYVHTDTFLMGFKLPAVRCLFSLDRSIRPLSAVIKGFSIERAQLR